MALISCPDCGKQISDQAPSCIGCGRPMPLAAQPAQAPAPSKATPEPVRPQTKAPLASPTVKAKGKPKTVFGFKPLILGWLLAFFINAVASTLAHTHIQGFPFGTFLWMYLTVAAWRFLKFGAVLPYLAFQIINAAAVYTINAYGLSASVYVTTKLVIHWGGLILFTIYLIMRVLDEEKVTVTASHSAPSQPIKSQPAPAMASASGQAPQRTPPCPEVEKFTLAPSTPPPTVEAPPQSLSPGDAASRKVRSVHLDNLEKLQEFAESEMGRRIIRQMQFALVNVGEAGKVYLKNNVFNLKSEWAALHDKVTCLLCYEHVGRVGLDQFDIYYSYEKSLNSLLNSIRVKTYCTPGPKGARILDQALGRKGALA